MTTIIVMHDDQEVDEFEFGLETRSINIGRRPANDVCIADRSVSGNHARIDIEADAGSAWIEDLESTNGTYINGRLARRSPLEEGDELLIGKVRVRFHMPAADELILASDAARIAHEASLDEVSGEELSVDYGYDGGSPARQAAESEPALVPEPVSEPGPAARVLAAEPQSVANAPDFVDDDDDELDESMREALALYNDDSPPPGALASLDDSFADDDDFAEDARLFAQPVAVADEEPAALESPGDIDDDRLPVSDDGIDDIIEAEPLTLSDRAKVALGREPAERRPRLRAVSNAGELDEDWPVVHARSADAHEAPVPQGHENRAQRPVAAEEPAQRPPARGEPHPLDDFHSDELAPTHDLEPVRTRSRGAVIEIKNGAKSGQILPIDKPVTTLGRPGIQIAAIMRKPDGYFLMHIESDDSVDRPTLNSDSIGDEPVLLHSGDELNVAGIDVEFMLS